MTLRKNQARALSESPGYGLRHHRNDSQNNVGMVPVAAGLDATCKDSTNEAKPPK